VRENTLSWPTSNQVPDFRPTDKGVEGPAVNAICQE
jgi:hypothetical protein